MELKDMVTTREMFPEFYSHPFIRSIEGNSRWTISDSEKKPIDMKGLKYEHKVMGAFEPSKLCLMTLQELTDLVPNAANHAYYLKALEDEYLVVDIEPECSDATKKEFLRMDYVYGEVSLSGKGYHLVFPVPAEIDKYPNAKAKKVWKNAKEHYEIHLEHYVTFTRRMLPDADGKKSFMPVFKKMAKAQSETVTSSATFAEVDIKDIPNGDAILRSTGHIPPWAKTLSDFDDDKSSYEYCHIGYLLGYLRTFVNTMSKQNGHKYTDDEMAELLYQTARNTLEHRDKHDTPRRLRDGRTVSYLKYQVYNQITANMARREKLRKKS